MTLASPLNSEVQLGDIVLTHGKHEISKFPYSRPNLQLLWTKIRKFKNLFNHEIRSDFKSFVSIFLEEQGDEIVPRGLVWVIDDFKGLFYVTKIVEAQEATAHIAIFDRSARDVELTKEMLRYVFRRFGFRRLNAEVPVYVNEQFFEFVKSIGFIEEGSKRKAVEFDDKWFDLRLYGMLATECLGVEAIQLGIS